MILFLFGGVNILGNIIVGKVFMDYFVKFIFVFLFLLGMVYIVFFVIGEYRVFVMFLMILWGVLVGGIMVNLN